MTINFGLEGTVEDLQLYIFSDKQVKHDTQFIHKPRFKKSNKVFSFGARAQEQNGSGPKFLADTNLPYLL